MLILKIYQVRLSRFHQSQCRSAGMFIPPLPQPDTRGRGWGQGRHLPLSPLPKVPPVPRTLAAIGPIGTSLPGSILPSPSTPGAVSPWCHLHLVSSKWVLIWGGGGGESGKGSGAHGGVALGRFDYFFCISVYFLLSLFLLYKMSGMVMGVGDTVTCAGSGLAPAAAPRSLQQGPDLFGRGVVIEVPSGVPGRGGDGHPAVPRPALPSSHSPIGGCHIPPPWLTSEHSGAPQCWLRVGLSRL